MLERSRSRKARIRFLLLLGPFVLAGCWYFFFKSSKSANDPLRPSAAIAGTTSVDFGESIALPGSPIGLSSDGEELVLGNRREPWGFIRLRMKGNGKLRAENVAIFESLYRQRIGLWAVTWNGAEYVGYTDGGWFQEHGGYVFTFHDGKTLEVLRHVPAPPNLGCLTWDGSGYWAATRRNTVEADEPAWLYRLDYRLNVVSTFEPPGVGCQGLAWDGELLWFADVFSANLHALEIGTSEPSIVQVYRTGFSYLSGVTFWGGDLWVAEYGTDRLHRLQLDVEDSELASPLPQLSSTPFEIEKQETH